jgi:orotidine-5'-phosphate decarboxylase
MNAFSERLAAAVVRCGNPVVVGIDPRYEQLPAVLLAERPTYAQQADAYRQFGIGIIDAVAGRVPAVKPQMAFFEALGPAGMVALADIVQHARRSELLVILDGKRNDIGSTATAYAEAYLGDESPWQADALTVSPYLGDDSLTPFDQLARQRNAGLFVLVKTSNPGGRMLQDLQADGRTVYRRVAEWVESRAAETATECGYGAMGAVVGATYPEQLQELRAAMPHTWFLVPGFGAQGGQAADVAAAFDSRGLGAIINSSRAIIFAYERPEFAAASSWQQAVADATDQMIVQLQAETPVGRLSS